MIYEISITILLQLLFFPIYYFKGPDIAKIIRKRVCPTCFSVGSTWLTLLILKFTGIWDIPHLLISILLAESVVGISYLSDEFLSRHEYKYVSEPILRFGIVIYGTLTVLTAAFISFPIGFAMFLPIIGFGFWALTPIK